MKENKINTVPMVNIEQHIDGDLKGFYVAEITGLDGKPMKGKTLSALLGKISKYFRGQGN